MEDKKYKDTSIGAIWIKSGQYGDYLSIQIEIAGVKHNFTAFPNKYKEPGDNKPSYRIPEPKAKDDGQSSYQSKIALVKEYQAKKPATQKPLTDIESEDLPF